jgi:hypothetical protein
VQPDVFSGAKRSVHNVMPTARSLTGKFTLTTNVNPVNGAPNTGIFDPLVGVHSGYRLSFTIANESLGSAPISGEKTHTVTTGPVKIEFPGAKTALLKTTIPKTLNGATLMFRLLVRGGAVLLDDFNFVGSPLQQYFGLELVGGAAGLAVDGAGYPVLGPFQIAASTIMLRRYVTPFAMTDFAFGPSSIVYQ